jgi:hypothetical protein
MEVIKGLFYPGSLIRHRRMEARINIYLQGVLFTQNY